MKRSQKSSPCSSRPSKPRSRVWLRDAGGLAPASREHASRFREKEESVAAWAFQKKQPAGLSTDTLPEAEALHLPLLAGDRAEGVLAVQMPRAPTLEQRELLDAFAAQLAVFVNKERALAQSREAALATQSQKLQKTLFDSVSHELKTPLAAMPHDAATAASQTAANCEQAARRLTRTVDHLLDATRLESGAAAASREWCDPGRAVARSGRPRALEARR